MSLEGTTLCPDDELDESESGAMLLLYWGEKKLTLEARDIAYTIPAHHLADRDTLLDCLSLCTLPTIRIAGQIVIFLLMSPPVECSFRICSSTHGHLSST
jgi:hypothetical protein